MSLSLSHCWTRWFGQNTKNKVKKLQNRKVKESQRKSTRVNGGREEGKEVEKRSILYVPKVAWVLTNRCSGMDFVRPLLLPCLLSFRHFLFILFLASPLWFSSPVLHLLASLSRVPLSPPPSLPFVLLSTSSLPVRPNHSQFLQKKGKENIRNIKLNETKKINKTK